MYPTLKDKELILIDKNKNKYNSSSVFLVNTTNGLFVKRLKIHGDKIDLISDNFKIVIKALDLNKNENCGLNDYLIDKNNFEYLVLKHGSYYLVISNYGILVQFNL